MFRAAYNGSWFNNQADTLTWDNPLVLTDSTSALRGMAGWPCGRPTRCRRSARRATRSSRGGRSSPARSPSAGRTTTSRCCRSRSTARCRSSRCRARRPTPRRTTVATTISLVSRPADDWRFSTRFRRYDYNNNMPDTADSAISSATTRRSGRARPAGRWLYRARPQHVRCRRHVDRLRPRGAHRRLHQQPQRL